MDTTVPSNTLDEIMNHSTNDTTIRILPDHLANQIAAGEVVQRPESVVKELVENAIDAGASTVTVVVKQAGKQLIHVIDDGQGMSRTDVELATVRHATSKIRTAEDLHAINTLGFRGEALASIAAVADVEIITRRPSESTGWTLASRPGLPVTLTPSVPDAGTQVVVRNLFYNVPARRKFLKSDLTEFRHISETMQKLALARSDRRIVFYDGNVLVFDVKPAPLQQRIADVLAIDAADTLLAADAAEGGIRVHGYVGRPAIARQQRSGQFMFLNGRPITSRQLLHAVASGYEHLLDRQHHPVFVLNIDVDPTRVDVNVHPQKHEVKFEDERLVYLLVQQATVQALQSANIVPSFTADLGLAHRPLQSLPTQGGGGGMVINRLTGEVSQSLPRSGGTWSGAAMPSPAFDGSVRNAFEQLVAGDLQAGARSTSGVLHLGSAWMVVCSDEGLVVIDRRAAHERVLYEQIMAGEAQAIAEQSVMFPVACRFAADDAAILREYAAELAELGFRIEVAHDGPCTIHAVPPHVHPGSEESVIRDLVASLRERGTIALDQRKTSMAAVMASQQSRRLHQRLTPGEQHALVADLFACGVPHCTATGKPTYMIITLDEIRSRLQ